MSPKAIPMEFCLPRALVQIPEWRMSKRLRRKVTGSVPPANPEASNAVSDNCKWAVWESCGHNLVL